MRRLAGAMRECITSVIRQEEGSKMEGGMMIRTR